MDVIVEGVTILVVLAFAGIVIMEMFPIDDDKNK
tara:strand:+ start:1928 stop:2029 length:102 start_codon:yes stop_codon:yes gene_type:complete